MIVDLSYRLLGSIWLMIIMLLFLAKRKMNLPVIVIISSSEYMFHIRTQVTLAPLLLRLVMGESFFFLILYLQSWLFFGFLDLLFAYGE